MDSINDLIGDAAKQLMAQADGIQNQKLKASAQRVAQTISAKTRDELISVARSDAYGRDTRFIKYLPITWRQKAVMGRVEEDMTDSEESEEPLFEEFSEYVPKFCPNCGVNLRKP